ncbi:MAG: sugar lactone lactonase YvrE [Kiritimatiellia bacterium]|jgi:sugar lactone lactonase YvrE
MNHLHRSTLLAVFLSIATATTGAGLAGCDAIGDPAATRLVAIGTEPRPSGDLVEGLTILALDDNGDPVADVRLELEVVRGGGTLTTATVMTGPQGEASVDRWRLGIVPVVNRLRVVSAQAMLNVDLEVVIDPLPTTSLFGDLNGYLEANDIDGSTEDLAFTPDGQGLVVGMKGGLLTLDETGAVTAWSLSGGPIERALGIAFEPDGQLLVCDFGGTALRRTSSDGAVSTVLTHDGADDLIQPNYVAVGPDGSIYLTDPCLGRLYRIDPATGAVTASLAFDLNTEGGPNGIAIDADGTLFVTTENTVLLCSHGDLDVELTEPIAGIFSTTFDGADFAPKTPVATGIGLFGDGAAFDAEGNLYAIFNTADGFELDESIVFVVPAGETTPRRFLAFEDRVVANLAFGRGAFGETTLYLTLLAFQPFVPADARGIVRIDVGIPGALLGHQ